MKKPLNIPLSGLLMLVCWRKMSLAERLSSKFQLPSKLRFAVNCSFFGEFFSLRHYPLIYQPPEAVYLLNSQ